MNLEKENEMTAQTFTIELPNFREARPVAEIVQTASQYESEIYFVSGNKKINAKSIMGPILQMSIVPLPTISGHT